MSDDFTDWMNSEPGLLKILEDLDSEDISLEEEAQKVFNTLCEKLELPKYPDNYNGQSYKSEKGKEIDYPRSVYEEIGILRYLEPDEDPRGIVLFAIYNIKNSDFIPLSECEIIHFEEEENIPESYIIYYLGEGAESELFFLEEGDNLNIAGLKYTTKVIRNNL